MKVKCHDVGEVRKPDLSLGGSAAIVGLVARVAELADAPDLGSGSERIGGSSPLARTNETAVALGQRRDINNRRTYQSMSATEANSSNAAAT